MPDKHKFTLKGLLVEVALVAVICALTRWVFFTELKDDSDRDFLSKLILGIPLLVALSGAALGFFFKRPLTGAVVAITLLGVVLGVALTFGFMT